MSIHKYFDLKNCLFCSVFHPVEPSIWYRICQFQSFTVCANLRISLVKLHEHISAILHDSPSFRYTFNMIYLLSVNKKYAITERISTPFERNCSCPSHMHCTFLKWLVLQKWTWKSNAVHAIPTKCTYSLQVYDYIILYTLLYVSAKVNHLQGDTQRNVYKHKSTSLLIV